VKWSGWTNPTDTDARNLYEDVPEMVVKFLSDVLRTTKGKGDKAKLARAFQQQLGIL